MTRRAVARIAITLLLFTLGCGVDRGEDPAAGEAASATSVTGIDPQIQYHHGPVMDGTIPIYVLFYGSFTTKQQTVASDFLHHLGSSNWFSIVRNYTDSSGHRPTGLKVMSVQTATGPALTDSRLEIAFNDAFGTYVDPAAIYVAFSSPGMGNPDGCGYHEYHGGAHRVYAWVPYGSGSYAGCVDPRMRTLSPNGDPGLDEMVAAVAHELAEAATDPQPFSGWMSTKINPLTGHPYSEIGDFCPTDVKYYTASGAPASVHLGTHDYLLQRIWLQETSTMGACALANPCASLPTLARRNACFTAATAGLVGPGHTQATIPGYPLDDWNHSPIGYIDVASCDSIAGWAEDADTADTPIAVHLYFDGPAGVGSGPYAVTAGDYRADLETAIGYGSHGFTFGVPLAFHDGAVHKVYAYGIDSDGGYNPLLTDSPKTFACPNHAPRGAAWGPGVDCTNNVIYGWATDDDTPSVATQVDIYHDAVTPGNLVWSGPANGNSPYPNTGFTPALPLSLKDNTVHTLFAYAHDTTTFAPTQIYRFAFSCPNRFPRGWFDRAGCDVISGWAIDDDTLGSSVYVDIYIGGPAGSGAPSYRVLANNYRGDTSPAGNFAFALATPPQFKNGAVYDVYAYAIDTWTGMGRGDIPLQPAPRHMQCVPGMNRKRGFVDWTSYSSYWRLPTNITISDNIANSYSDGLNMPYSPMLGRRQGDPNTVYLIDGSYRRGVTAAAMANWGFRMSDVIYDVTQYPDGALVPEVPTLIETSTGGRYVLDY